MNYARKVRGLLHGAWALGFMNGKVSSTTIIDRTAVPKPPFSVEAVKEHEEKFLQVDELKIVLSLVRKKSSRLADVFEFQSRTGLRFGELVALREEDFTGNALRVSGTYVWVERKRGTPKNAYSVRTVELDNRARAIVEAFILYNKQQRA